MPRGALLFLQSLTLLARQEEATIPATNLVPKQEFGNENVRDSSISSSFLTERSFFIAQQSLCSAALRRIEGCRNDL